MDPPSTPRPRSWIAGPLLLYNLIYSLVSLVGLHIMSTLIRRFSQRIDYIAETRAPLNSDGARPHSGLFEKKVSEIHDLAVKSLFTVSDLPAFLDAVKNASGVGLDDRELLLEKLIVLMSRLKNIEFSMSMKMQQVVIKLLYKDLPHPPSGYLGLLPTTNPSVIPASSARVKYAYRSADGSNNNVLFPTLGQAGSPYARSVSSKNISPKSALPDPGLVFDTLLKRDKFVPHRGGISALFFAFADLVIHSIFNTNHTDWTINDASSYLDLSVLYGSCEQDVRDVRRIDGSGKLWDDVFADSRLLHMPPASCALLVLMNRNHNYIAQRILDINENGNLQSNPFPADESTRKAQDDEIFQRTRLVNCGYFMHIILGDYVGAILGLARDGSDWRLDPLMTMREIGHEFVPRGEGNVVSLEFNLLYRWHATLSQRDTEWTAAKFSELFDEKPFSDITVEDFKDAAHKKLIPPADLKTWDFGGIKRRQGGRFEDADLANILHNSTEAPAGAFGARGIPEALRVIEIMGIKQSRTWGTCSLNEFRKFLGLKPYSNFEEWNPDEKIHTAAAALYKNIDNLELHVGLQAEETKKSGPGAGLCPGYTISRAILADAVCLSRGDRFMTTEMNPFNLTSWGYQDCQYDTKDGSYGGLLTKLLFRTLPDYYPRGTAYAHFPFLDPVYMKGLLKTTNPGLVDKYTWERPNPPKPTFPIDTYVGAKQVLTSPDFVSAYEKRLFEIAKPVLTKRLAKDTLESSDKKKAAFIAAQRTLTKGTTDISKYIFANPPDNISTFFKKKADALIKAKSFAHVGKPLSYVDIVKDVINLLPVHWISQDIAGLPLKCASNPSGAWYEQDVYDKFSGISRYVYLNLDPVDDWHLREVGQSDGKEIIECIKGHVDRVDSWVSLSDSQNHLGIEGYNSHAFLKKLWQAHGKKYSHREFSAQVFAAVVPTAALFSQAVSNVVNFYLGAEKASERQQIVDLVRSSSEDATRKVMGYVYEALRLDPPVAGVYRTAAKDVNIGADQLQTGDHTFVNIIDANLDPTIFGKEDSSPNYARAADNSGVVGFGEYGLLTSKFFEATVPGILGVILGLKDLQRGPGKSGSFARFKDDIHGTHVSQYINLKGLVTPWPDSLIVQYHH